MDLVSLIKYYSVMLQCAWFGYEIKPVYDAKSGGIIEQLKNGTEIYLAARAFKEKVVSGDVQVQQDESSADDEQF